MNRKELQQRLFALTQWEQERKEEYEKTGQFLQQIDYDNFWDKNDDGVYLFSTEKMLSIKPVSPDSTHAPICNKISQNNLRLIAHSRYQQIPFHKTEFVSINYIYSGRLIVDFPNRKREILLPGQLIFMNSDIVHALTIECETDIILGIQIEKKYLDVRLLRGLKGTGPVADFFISTMTGKSSDFSYLTADFGEDDKVRNLMEDIFCEYLEPGIASDFLVENYIRNLFTFMIRSSHLAEPKVKEKLIDILAYIQEHFTDCSLSGLAERFYFSPKYLSSLLKKETGFTFQQHLENVRMQMACYFLENSQLSVREIARNCGYSNLTFFYKRFEKRFSMNPSQYRRNIMTTPSSPVNY